VGWFPWVFQSCGKNKADNSFFVFANHFKLPGGAKEKLKACGKIAQAVFRRNGIERKARAVIEDFEANAAGLLRRGYLD
jgi:hypothetical protein